MVYLDLGILVGGWLAAQILFHGYEAHVPLAKRTAKLAVLFVVFLAIHLIAGRSIFFAFLLLMTLGIAVLHGYWFHCRHGVHWRTAEPREKYFRLIGYTRTSDDSQESNADD